MVGTIDGSHIPLKTVPVNEQIEYFNCKQDYSIVVQAVANASFKFLDVSTGFPGSIHYAHVLQLSKLHREVSRGNWLNGPSKQIGACEVGPLLVRDSAYPLSKWLMNPFKQTHTLTDVSTKQWRKRQVASPSQSWLVVSFTTSVLLLETQAL